MLTCCWPAFSAVVVLLELRRSRCYLQWSVAAPAMAWSLLGNSSLILTMVVSLLDVQLLIM